MTLFMRWFYKIPLRLRSLSRKSRVEQELTDELRFHLEKLIEEKVGKGMTPEEARYAALRELGGVEQIKEECRDMRRVNYIENFLQDVRYGLRQLRRNPGFTAVAVVTLALGIGANAAVFSLVNAVLLKPLPYRQPDELVKIWSTNPPNAEVFPSTLPDFHDWKLQSRSFEDLAGYCQEDFVIGGNGYPERVTGAIVTANFLRVLGVTPVQGRDFVEGEEQFGSDDVVILSHGLWQLRFAGDAGVLGKSLAIDGRQRRIIGVTPPGFRNPGLEAKLYIPMAVAPGDNRSTRNEHFLEVLGRLKGGISKNQAQADMQAIAKRLEGEHPQNKGMSVMVSSLARELRGEAQGPLLALSLVTAFFLSIVCANLANLLVGRGLARQKELAIRAAIGASGKRLARQMFTEALVLSAAGGAVGVFLSLWGMNLLKAVAPERFARLLGSSIDVRFIVFVGCLCLLVALAFGLVPTLRSSRINPAQALKAGGRSSSGDRGGRYLRHLFVGLQTAIAIVLLTGAGLFTRSLFQLYAVDPGFKSGGVLTLQITLPNWKYAEGPQTAMFYFTFGGSDWPAPRCPVCRRDDGSSPQRRGYLRQAVHHQRWRSPCDSRQGAARAVPAGHPRILPGNGFPGKKWTVVCTGGRSRKFRSGNCERELRSPFLSQSISHRRTDSLGTWQPAHHRRCRG